jgi:cytochrome oxidase Cu insertion factor (SCO1/SenC/PrrC family)
MQKANDWARFWSRLDPILHQPKVAAAQAWAKRLPSAAAHRFQKATTGRLLSPVSQRLQRVPAQRLLWYAGCGVLALVLLVGLLVVHLNSGPVSSPLQGTTLDSQAAPAFTLPDQNGKITNLAQFRGHPVVLTFFDSVCPHTDCSLMAAYINQTAKDLGVSETNQVGWVALSLNPWHDTPATARAFLSTRDVTIPMHFVLGPLAQMAPLWSAYHIQSILQPDGVVIHTTGVYVIDQHGRERVFMDEGFNPQTLSNDLHVLLTNPGVANAHPSTSGTSNGGIQPGYVSLTRTSAAGVISLIASPSQYGTYDFEVQAWEAQGLPAQGTANIDLSMISMNMGVLHVPLNPSESDTPGVYSAHGVLSMEGGWQAVVTVKPVDGSPAIQETFEFNAKY